MKEIRKDSIVNIDENLFDRKFRFPIFEFDKNDENIVFMEDLLKEKRNEELEKNIGQKYAIYSNVYSAKDELEIFQNIFDEAIKTGKKVHIVGITLEEEVKILEEYYEKLGFLRDDINCFRVDYSKVLVSVSVKIENLMWRGSDYKRMGKSIYFIPPIREAGQVKAMFKGINRGSIAGIYTGVLNEEKKSFLQNSLKNEDILTLTLGKTLFYNLEDTGLKGEKSELILEY